jgi:glycosyltransferase involved in cell wall biosynthesis
MRYIIDVTQLVHWPGNLSGIPRVMHELAIRFNDSDKQTIFVSWVKETSGMCVVDLNTSLNGSKRKPVYLQQGATGSGASVSAPSIDTKALLKKLAAKARLDRTGLYKKLRSTAASRAAEQYKRYKPQAGDKFLIIYGEWWDQNYIDLLAKYASSGVELFPVCHDIVPMILPQFSGNSASLSDFVTQIYPLSKCVISISKSTKDDLTRWMKEHKLKVPPIELFREGESFTITAEPKYNVGEKYQVEPNNFIIFVGTIEPRKNHTLLYYVYKLAKARGIHLPHLLMIGRTGHHSSEIIDYIQQDPEVNDKISILNNVDDAELGWMYSNALFMVSPSWYEGWGIPIVESVVKGNPTVCSNTSSMTEIAEDCVTHFSPSSTDECLDAIINMLEPKMLAKYRAKCVEYKPHLWDDAFRQILKIMEK